MTKHTIYTFDDFGKYKQTLELYTNNVHPSNFTTIAPDFESGKTPVWNFDHWVNSDNSNFETSFDKLKNERLHKCRNDFNLKIEQIKKDNAAYEIDTWNIQNNEWTMYIANNESTTPYVNALAEARGISREELMEKIGIKIIAIATLQGTQHSIEDKIKLTETFEELNKIIW